jgi:2-oxoacid:acceptor oxidoreductase, delta subunit, pyruvate/2-ketoisovalerate family
VKLALSVFLAVAPLDIKTVEAPLEASPVIIVPFEPAQISSPTINALGNSPLRRTGNWRVFRPVWNREVCTKCMACLTRCPDGCISLDEEGFPCVDYENCKGCLICIRACPVEGIEKVREAQVL